MTDKALEMFGELPDFPGKRMPKNRPNRKRDLDIVDRLNGAKPKTYKVNGEDKVFFTIGELGKALDRKPVTIRMWESRGWIPKATYRTPKPRGNQIPDKSLQGRRLYSLEQVEFLMEAMKKFFIHTDQPDWAGFKKHIANNYPK